MIEIRKREREKAYKGKKKHTDEVRKKERDPDRKSRSLAIVIVPFV